MMLTRLALIGFRDNLFDQLEAARESIYRIRNGGRSFGVYRIA